MEQPNVTGDGETELTPTFWLAVVVTGVVTGLFGALLMLVLFSVEHAVFGYSSGTLEAGVRAAGATRRIVVLLSGGVIAGVGWYLLRRFTRGEKAEVDEAIWHGDARLSFRRSLANSILSEIAIGCGASIGREAAPKLLGGASASVLSGWMKLSVPQRRLLVACGAGAGFAAVYNVPLGGALFTAELLIGSITIPVVLPALVCCCIATATAWVYLPSHATYLDIPAYPFHPTLLAWALLAGPVIGLLASTYIRLIGWVSFHQIKGRLGIGAPIVAFGLLGIVAIRYPQLLGNGRDMAHDAFVGSGTLGLLLALAVLKPIVTSLCLGSGASGGLFTPVMSTGAVLGGGLGILWSHLWPGAPVGAFAIIGAAAMIGAGMQAPLAALVLVLELTHSGFALMVPIMVATAGATLTSRSLDGYSIYSARLSAVPDDE